MDIKHTEKKIYAEAFMLRPIENQLLKSATQRCLIVALKLVTKRKN